MDAKASYSVMSTELRDPCSLSHLTGSQMHAQSSLHGGTDPRSKSLLGLHTTVKAALM